MNPWTVCSLLIFLVQPTLAFVAVYHQAATRHQNSQRLHCSRELDKLISSLPDPVVAEPLSGPGFCNQLYRVTTFNSNGSEQTYVAKIFSDMAKERRPTTEFAVDILASEENLGPKILQHSPDGLLMEYLDGDMLTEIRNELKPIAHQLKRLHSLPTCTSEQPNMLWYSLQVMMKECTCPLLKEAYEYQKNIIASQQEQLVECCGHGDMKASNVFVSANDTIRFIDFELSGRHYRGFDVAKLFRTDEGISEEHLQEFCQYYDKEDAAAVQLEAEVLMPLTVRSSL